MNKIQNTSRLFRIFFQIIFIMLPILSILYWTNSNPIFGMHSANGGINPGTFITFVPEQVMFAVHQPISSVTRFYGFLASMLPIVSNMLILYYLIKLFSLYEKDKIFTQQNTLYFNRIGVMLLVGQVANFIYRPLIGIILSWTNGLHHRLLLITFSNSNIGVILTGIVVILISWIMGEGHKLNEEQQYTI